MTKLLCGALGRAQRAKRVQAGQRPANNATGTCCIKNLITIVYFYIENKHISKVLQQKMYENSALVLVEKICHCRFVDCKCSKVR